MTASGNLFVVSAPSGAGKTSLVAALVEADENVVVSVSHTTRARRPGEVAGADYHFVSVADFESLLDRGVFLEHARVFDNYYGTSRDRVVEQLDAGRDVVLEIDWQGARLVRGALPGTVGIFILPPSLGALRERLSGRGQDSEAVIDRRMRDAVSEASHYAEFDFLVVNDEFETALADLRAIVSASRLERETQCRRYAQLLAQLVAENDPG